MYVFEAAKFCKKLFFLNTNFGRGFFILTAKMLEVVRHWQYRLYGKIKSIISLGMYLCTLYAILALIKT